MNKQQTAELKSTGAIALWQQALRIAPGSSAAAGLAYVLVLAIQWYAGVAFVRMHIEEPLRFGFYSAVIEEAFFGLFVFALCFRKKFQGNDFIAALLVYKGSFVLIEVGMLLVNGMTATAILPASFARLGLHAFVVAGPILFVRYPLRPWLVGVLAFFFGAAAHTLYNYTVSRYTVHLVVPYSLITAYWMIAMILAGMHLLKARESGSRIDRAV